MIKAAIKTAVSRIRVDSKSNMFWTGRSEHCPNFGDLIGPYLYFKITGKHPSFRSPSNLALNTEYVTAGSLIHWVRMSSVVWGSGVVEKDQLFIKPHRTHAVRGPLTRAAYQRLGFECPAVYGDPAILLPLVYPRKSRSSARQTIGIVPHYTDKNVVPQSRLDDLGITPIDVFDSIENVVDQISGCTHIVSSSLHGLIVAHAYGIPCAWIRLSDNIWGDGTKFLDHYQSLGIDLDVSQRLEEQHLNLDLPGMIERFPQPGGDKVRSLSAGLITSCPYASEFSTDFRTVAREYFGNRVALP